MIDIPMNTKPAMSLNSLDNLSGGSMGQQCQQPQQSFQQPQQFFQQPQQTSSFQQQSQQSFQQQQPSSFQQQPYSFQQPSSFQQQSSGGFLGGLLGGLTGSTASVNGQNNGSTGGIGQFISSMFNGGSQSVQSVQPVQSFNQQLNQQLNQQPNQSFNQQPNQQLSQSFNQQPNQSFNQQSNQSFNQFNQQPNQQSFHQQAQLQSQPNHQSMRTQGVLLRKGQKTSISKNNPNLDLIEVGLGWDLLPGGASYDLDVEAFMLGSNDRVVGDDWFVFYNQESSPDNSVQLLQTSEDGAADGDDEIIQIRLSKISTQVSKIVFVVTINDALTYGYNFGQVSNVYLRIVDRKTNKELVRFNLTEYHTNVCSTVVGELYKHNNEWKFNPLGNGLNLDLEGLCQRYGVNLA